MRRICSRLALMIAITALLSGCSSIIVSGTIGADVPGDSPSKVSRRPAIPPGHMPPAGKCRIWHPGAPPGHQPPPGECADLGRRVPPGAWLIRG